MIAEDFRRIALGFDGAEERSHMGAADFRVGGRIFATLASISEGYGNLMLSPEQQADFVAEQPDVYAPIKGGWGRMGMTHIRLEAADGRHTHGRASDGVAGQRGRHGFAVGVDLRIPTGDEKNLLGSGTPGVRPFVAWSASAATISPHFNAGYLWNGSSVLAGNVAEGESADLADQMFYTIGADMPIGSRVTVAFDVLGRVYLDAPRIQRDQFRSPDGVTTFPNIRFTNQTFTEHDGAIGVKLNIAGELLLDFNVLFRLDDNGLRDNVTPLIGFEYAM